jgi:hypothetical protein
VIAISSLIFVLGVVTAIVLIRRCSLKKGVVKLDHEMNGDDHTKCPLGGSLDLEKLEAKVNENRIGKIRTMLVTSDKIIKDDFQNSPDESEDSYNSQQQILPG